ncbi:MAG: glutaminase A [Solirubrobacterales bacterium]|nr:glutaminase A [Solirubrobacterales bacterium]OJU96215.1 MAG: glutaminase A [Solirubrobacterales bacterium 67-14]
MNEATRTASPVQALLERLHERHAGDMSGEVASYIPELATADPAWFGISMVTADGAVYEVGDTQREFTIQSISKPLTFALALETAGEETVRQHVDVEPSGEAFNSITLQPGTGRPLNPMVNAGAIATTSLITPLGFDKPIDRILNEYSAFAGRDLSVDEEVFGSENETGHRNRAIAYLLRNADVVDHEVEDVVETYFRQCSTLVTCRDLAVIAATLASTGFNPVTRERVLREDTVRNVLSVMASCGMYDSAGDWLYTVGLPAKSGVAGGIIAVLPGQLGIAVYSPPLDVHGNSVRGIKVCEDLSDELHLHVMSPARRPPPPVRVERTCLDSRSKRLRSPAEQQVLAEHGDRVKVLELQGELSFAAGELVTSSALERADHTDFAVLDFYAVRSIDLIDVPIFSHLIESYEEAGGEIAFSDVDRHPLFADDLNRHREKEGLHPVRTFADLDLALEWCEQGLIEKYGDVEADPELSLAQHGATLGMSVEEIELLSSHLEHVEFEAGDMFYGTELMPPEQMLLVTAGKISLLAKSDDGGYRRLATLSPGMTLGEVSMIAGTSLAGLPRADTAVKAWALTEGDLEVLRAKDPGLVVTLLENLLRQVAQRVGHMRADLLR